MAIIDTVLVQIIMRADWRDLNIVEMMYNLIEMVIVCEGSVGGTYSLPPSLLKFVGS